jgi:hypothetical protein
MDSAKWLKDSAEVEFAGVELGDVRRGRRLQQVAARLSEEPGKSFPQTFEAAELEGFYRLLRNESVTWEAILEPHLAATCERASQIAECLAIHDTTEFSFKGRDALGATSSSAKGFFGHFSLLVAMDAARTPLGVGSLQQYVRKGRKKTATRQEVVDDPESEARRWYRSVEALEKRAAGKFSCIHVTDREGDIFEFLSKAVSLEARFVVRATYDRKIVEDDETTSLHEPLLRLKPTVARNISISLRGKGLTPTMDRSHPPRGAREAAIVMAATTVSIISPNELRTTSHEIELNVVRVWEPKPPSGQAPVEWILYTTEPVDTPEQIERVVDIYRARWTIEEFFKALKTGCSIERRQLETFDTLTNAVAIFIPIAWRMLLARSVSRSTPDRPPTDVLTPVQIRILELKLKRPLGSAKDALFAIARLGGHLPQNGDPGWQTIGRGFEELLLAEYYFSLGQNAARSDQS